MIKYEIINNETDYQNSSKVIDISALISTGVPRSTGDSSLF